jgi:hypothetical protein
MIECKKRKKGDNLSLCINKEICFRGEKKQLAKAQGRE